MIGIESKKMNQKSGMDYKNTGKKQDVGYFYIGKKYTVHAAKNKLFERIKEYRIAASSKHNVNPVSSKQNDDHDNEESFDIRYPTVVDIKQPRKIFHGDDKYVNENEHKQRILGRIMAIESKKPITTDFQEMVDIQKKLTQLESDMVSYMRNKAKYEKRKARKNKENN
jgi:hypothetical protein